MMMIHRMMLKTHLLLTTYVPLRPFRRVGAENSVAPWIGVLGEVRA
jgi:hypothetical protein